MPPKSRAATRETPNDEDLTERLNRLELENRELRQKVEQLEGGQSSSSSVVTGNCLLPEGCIRGRGGKPNKACPAANWKFGPMTRCSYHGGGYRCVRGKDNVRDCLGAANRQWKGPGGYSPDGLPAAASGPDSYCNKCAEEYSDELDDGDESTDTN